MNDPHGISAEAAARTAAVTQGAARLFGGMGLAVLREVPLADGRRADLVCLAADGTVTIVEVKSCARDFLTDAKWQTYRAWCDRLFFAVDDAFPLTLLPGDVGVVVADAYGGAVLREPSSHPLAPARRRTFTLHVARLAARRAEAACDPRGMGNSLIAD